MSATGAPDAFNQAAAHGADSPRGSFAASESSDGLRLRAAVSRQNGEVPLQALGDAAAGECYASSSATSSALPKDWTTTWPPSPPRAGYQENTQPASQSSTTITAAAPSLPTDAAEGPVEDHVNPMPLSVTALSEAANPNVVPSGAATVSARDASAKSNRNSSLTAFTPAVILDGSKLILRLAKNARFTLDSPCKILLSTPNVRLDKVGCWQTSGVCGEPENTIVIDSGSPGLRFVPIPLSHFGTIYTKDSVAHVTIGNAIHRSKVHSRNMPYRTCNKFSTLFMPNDIGSSAAPLDQPDNIASWLLRRQATARTLGSIDPEQAAGLIKSMAADPQVGTVFIRADDSIIRYRLRHDEAIDLHSGRVVAWSLGVRFEQTNTCCLRFVTAIRGEGTVWISSSSRTPSQATGF